MFSIIKRESCQIRCIRRYATKARRKSDSQSASNPLAQELAARQRKFPWYDRKRVNITSEGLCDDVLKYIAPSLKDYAGCDIVDLGPGIGMWSRKVHEFLQPRSHLLVESESYRTFLDPLIQRHESTYKYLPIDFVRSDPAAWSWSKFIDQLSELRKDSKTRKLLLLCNFAVDKIASPTFDPRNAAHSVEQLIHSMAHRLYCNAEPFKSNGGPPRILLWMPDRQKFHFIPRSINQSLTGNWNAVKDVWLAQEVIGDSKPHEWNRRMPILEIESALNVAKRMKEEGYQMLEHRQTHFQKWIRDTDIPHHKYISKLENLEKDWAFERFQKYKKHVKGDDKRLRPYGTGYKRLLDYRDEAEKIVYGSSQPFALREKAINAFVYESVVIELERSLACGKSLLPELIVKDLEGSQELVANLPAPVGRLGIQGLRKKVSALLSGQTNRYELLYKKHSDDYQAFKNRPVPTLIWDQRSFEPLNCNADEFHPQMPLSLLDFQPRATSKLQESYAVARFWARFGGDMGSLPVYEALDRLAHGAGEALVPQCPSFTDPLKGGRLDVRDLRLRMLTPEMWDQLVEAWNAWPFRTSQEIISSKYWLPVVTD